MLKDDPLNSRYEQLQCELLPIEADSDEFSMVLTDLVSYVDLNIFISSSNINEYSWAVYTVCHDHNTSSGKTCRTID